MDLEEEQAGTCVPLPISGKEGVSMEEGCKTVQRGSIA